MVACMPVQQCQQELVYCEHEIEISDEEPEPVVEAFAAPPEPLECEDLPPLSID